MAPNGPLESKIRRMAVSVRWLELKGFWGSLRTVPRLRAFTREIGAEVLHTFQPWSGTVAQLSAPRGAVVFRSVRGHDDEPRSLEERVHVWLERWASRKKNRRLTVSVEEARAAVAYRFGVGDVEVVPECVDLGRVRDKNNRVRLDEARLRMGLINGQRAVAVFSDFRDRTRAAHILEGFAAARIESPELRLFFVGQGPEEGAARWKAEELRLEDSVVFLRSPSDTTSVLRVANAVIDAGTWPGWSLRAVEGMGLGLPVLRWFDDDDVNDESLYPSRISGPAQRFARGLLDVLEDETLRARAVRRSGDVAHRFDVSTVADRWAELYAVAHTPTS